MDLDFKLVEQKVVQENLIIHNQKTKRTLLTVDANHTYFEKRIVWDLMKGEDIQVYLETEVETFTKELFQPAYSEVKDFKTLGNHILIKQVLDGNNCFEFPYQPETNDIIMLCEVYRFNSLKSIRRSERMIRNMCFIYASSGWSLIEQNFKRSKVFKSGLLVNKTAPNIGIAARGAGH